MRFLTIFCLKDEYRVRGKRHMDFSFVVPNKYTLPDEDPQTWCVEDISDNYDKGYVFGGHGTEVAGIAAGTTHGIASKADLYLIKGLNCWVERNATTGEMIYHDVKFLPDATRVAFERVEEIVKARNLQGKAVVSFTVGEYFRFGLQVPRSYLPPGGHPTLYYTAIFNRVYNQEGYKQAMEEADTYHDVWTRFRNFCKENGVILVFPAGNHGVASWPDQYFLGDLIPHVWSGPDSELIFVGGSWWTGQMWAPTTQPGVTRYDGSVTQDPHTLHPFENLGQIDIYALAESVDVMGRYGIETEKTGTSFSSPLVVS